MDAFIVKEKKMHRIKSNKLCLFGSLFNKQSLFDCKKHIFYSEKLLGLVTNITNLKKVGTDPRTPYAGNSSKDLSTP